MYHLMKGQFDLAKNLLFSFYHDEEGDVVEKAFVIGAILVAVVALFALGALAAAKLNEAGGWFS